MFLGVDSLTLETAMASRHGCWVAVFAAATSSGPAARWWICQQWARHGHDQVRDAVGLLVSELTTNAILHTTSTHFLVRVDCTDDGVAVAVHDDCPTAPQIRQVDTWEDGGRGLPLVAALSDAWGVCTATSGKWVWFTLQHVLSTGGA